MQDKRAVNNNNNNNSFPDIPIFVYFYIYGKSNIPLILNEANTSDTEAEFLDLHLSISNDIDSAKIYDKRDFDFEIVNFPF